MVKKLITFPPVALALEMAHTYIRVGVARSAAALSYFLILTLFPMLLCVNYFIGLFHLDLEQLLTALDQLLPAQALAIMEDYLAYAADIQSPALLAAGLFTILVSASAGIRTLFLTMDELYQVRRNNGPARFLLSLGLSLLFLLTIYLSVVVIFTGDWFFGLLQTHLPPRVVELIPLQALSGLWRWTRYLLLFFFFLLLVLVIYRVGTPRDRAGRRIVRGAALLASLPWWPAPSSSLVYRPVFSVYLGVRLLGLADHPAGMAVFLRKYPAFGGNLRPGCGPEGREEAAGTARVRCGPPHPAASQRVAIFSAGHTFQTGRDVLHFLQ